MPKRPEIMHLDLDAFFASVEQKLHPELKGKPVIVCNVDPHGRNCYGSIVSTASYEARKFGIRSGMATFQAKKLCPSGIFVQGSFGEYGKNSELVFEIVKRFAPEIQQVSLDEAFLDFAGTNILYLDLVKVAREIKETIKKEAGLVASIGLASTKVVAKVASDFEKPDGLTVVPLGEEKRFLSSLPLRDLPGLGPQTEKVFLNWGLRTIGDLANLPENLVKERLGKSGLTLWNHANGRDSIWFSHPDVFANQKAAQKSVSRSLTFPQKSNDQRYLLSILQFLTEKVASDLREKGLKGGCLAVQVRFSDLTHSGTQQVLNFSTNHSSTLYRLAEKLFLRLWDGKAIIRLLGVGVSRLATSENTGQLALFNNEEERLGKRDQAVAKIRGKFGFRAVLPASLLKTGLLVVKYRL